MSVALFRATHTLAGNPLARIGDDGRGQRRGGETIACAQGKPAPMQPDHMELLARFEATVTELVNALNNGGGSAIALKQRFAGTSRTRTPRTPRSSRSDRRVDGRNRH